MRVLWCIEEGESFGRTARRFGIAPGLVEVVRRDRVAELDWPARLRALQVSGLAAHRGKGVKGDPRRWRATGPS
jgi:hypothetical protein